MIRMALARTFAGTGLMFTICMTGPAMADGDAEFSLGLEVGISSDSNVGVDGVGQAGTSDTVYNFGLDAGVKINLTDRVSFNAGYDYSVDQYADYDVFSQQSHSFLGGLRGKLDKVTLGLDYTYIATLLDGEGFLDMQVISPSVSGFFTDTVFLRAAYSRYEKDFDVLNDRNASSDIVTVDAFVFFDGYHSFLDLRATVEQENADTDPFDYDGYAFGAFLDLAVDGLGRENTLELGASYRDRDYDSITPSIAARRQDEKLEFEIALEVPLTEMAHVRGGFKYVDRSSNLPVADYDEHIISIKLGMEF